MRTVISWVAGAGRTLCLIAAITFTSTSVFAQTNSWITPTSGNWEDAPSWSLGALPGPGETILLTNSGWKALAIGPNTSQIFPQTLNIGSLYLSSPGTDTVNTLLLNFSGLQIPLKIGMSNQGGSFVIGTNCNVVMLSSALNINGSISVGGTFNESENSTVTAGVLRVGNLAPGVFNLTNSSLDAVGEFVGGFPATFSQQGGTNITTLFVTNSGEYDLYDGTFHGNLEMTGGTFNQFAGDVSVSFSFMTGLYQLAGGTLSSGDVTMPSASGAGAPSFAAFSQTGGTGNFRNVTLGIDGVGIFGLSGGTLTTSNLDLEYFQDIMTTVNPSTFSQSGGCYTNSGISIGGAADRSFFVTQSRYELDGGILSTPSIGLNDGAFTQTGGTNIVSSISMSQVSFYTLSGGWLQANSIEHSGVEYHGQFGSFQQSGGTNLVGSLSLGGGSSYILNGGRLSAGQIQLGGATFYRAIGSSAPGLLDSLNLLTLANATWDEQTGGQQSLGQLQLSGNTNSYLILPNASSTLNFANSSGLTWSNAATLVISNWFGSPSGGGSQQIFFGADKTALTSQQLSQIQFQLGTNDFSAKILSTGEVVPDQAILPLVSYSKQGNNLVLIWPAGWTLQTATNVSGPYVNVSGANSPYTNDTTADPQRFFRIAQ